MQKTAHISHSEQHFLKIYEENYKMVFSLVFNYLRSTEEAEEVTQDVFVKVYFSLDSFENRSSLKTWIFRIAVNASLEHLKKKKRKKRFGFIIPLFNEDTGIDNTRHLYVPGAQESMEKKEIEVSLQEAIDDLPPNQKTAFLLFKMDELSYKEVATIMDTSESAVDSLLSRARSNLKKYLEKKYPSRRKKE